MILIVDASVIIAWLVEYEQSAYTEHVLAAFGTDHAIVPAIWHWELANTLLILERKGRLADAITTYPKSFVFRSMSNRWHAPTIGGPRSNSNVRASIG